MEIPKEETKKVGVPVGLFLLCLIVALAGGGAATYFYLPQVKVVEKQVNAPGVKVPGKQSYSSDQYGYSFSYPDTLRLERSSKAEGGYVQESIDLYDPAGSIRMSAKVISKKGVQCPYYSLDQFVHCAFLMWQNVGSAPLNMTNIKGIRLVQQSQLAPYDIQVATYFDKGDYVFEVSDFMSRSNLDADYTSLLQSFSL